MRVSPRMAWPAAVVVVVGCGGSDPKQQIEKIDSARAMTALTSDALAKRHVSRNYARVTLRRLRDEVEQLGQSDKATPEVKAHADSALRAIALALPATR